MEYVINIVVGSINGKRYGAMTQLISRHIRVRPVWDIDIPKRHLIRMGHGTPDGVPFNFVNCFPTGNVNYFRDSRGHLPPSLYIYRIRGTFH